jgi:hypothetical protein
MDIGASTTLGQIPLNTLRWDQTGVVAPTQSWMTINYPSSSTPTVMQLTFNTPVGNPPATQCGRVLFNEYHVYDGTFTGETFPAECPALGEALTAQEELLEFTLFDLSTFVSPDVAPTETVGVTTTPTVFVQNDSADTININVTNTSTTSPK